MLNKHADVCVTRFDIHARMDAFSMRRRNTLCAHEHVCESVVVQGGGDFPLFPSLYVYIYTHAQIYADVILTC